ncbi:MAG: hypothetical protein ACRELY_10140 [Polyangiaceae bacterium]
MPIFYDNGCIAPSTQRQSAYGCGPVECTCIHNPVMCKTETDDAGADASSGFCWSCPN